MDHVLKSKSGLPVKGQKETVRIQRLKQFAIHGCKCHFCGIEGNTVLVTRDSGGGIHADVYHIDPVTGEKIVMTRDHIRPVSKKGDNSVWNMRPACGPCNWKRGNEVTKADLDQWNFNQRWARNFNRMFHPWGHKKPNWIHNKISMYAALAIPIKRQYQIAKIITKLLDF